MAWGTIRTSWARPPIHTAAAATCAASTAIVKTPRPGSPACPEYPGTTIVHTPRATAGTASAAAPRRLRRTVAKAAAAQMQKMAARSIPRPNSRPKRVAWMAEATGPRWSNASQNDTPATSAPWRVSATQPPASIRTAAAVKSWVARVRSRRSAMARGCPSMVARTGRQIAARKTTPPITSMSPQK